MADLGITVAGGTTKRLLTAGKYCDKNILVTATGGGGQPEPPDDGKTRLYITVPANSMPDRPPPRNEVPLYISQTVANGVTIDWGDGSDPETLPGTGNVNTTHTYQQAGDYVISLDPADGCELGLGHGLLNTCVMGNSNISGDVYFNSLKRVVIGDRGITSIGNRAFNDCSSLVSVSITNGLTSIGVNAFDGCASLQSIGIPEGVTEIGMSAFSYCDSLGLISIPEGVSSIADSTFSYCGSLASILIPESVTSIKSRAFKSCYSMKEYHFFSTAPPELSATAFDGIQSDCVIYVPAGSLEAYQTATNWSTYAGQMREEGT